MPLCGYAMMWMSAWDCSMMWMSIWCKCPLMGVSWMRMPACMYAMNVNARLGMQWMPMPAWVCNECKCLFGSMPWCECLLESMPWRECPLVGMQWMQMPSCRYIMTQNALVQTQFIQKFLLFSKRGFHNTWNQNILKTWFIIHEKSSSFWLKTPKKIGDHY